MTYIKNGKDLISFVNEKQQKEKCLSRVDVNVIPNISRAEILEIGRALSYDHTLAALRGGGRVFFGMFLCLKVVLPTSLKF